MISKHIHFIWIPTGRSPVIPADVAGNVAAWERLHPDYELTVWDAAGVASVCREIDVAHNIGLGALLPLCRFEAMVSDIGRLAILFVKGGFYSDLKNLPQIPFLDGLAAQGAAIIPEHAPTVKDYQGRVMNSFLAGPARHPLFLDCLRVIEDRMVRRSAQDVYSVTGAGPLRYVMDDHQRRALDDFVLVPSEQAWGAQGGTPSGWMKRTSASYNGPGMEQHWSHRQAGESIFLDPQTQSAGRGST